MNTEPRLSQLPTLTSHIDLPTHVLDVNMAYGVDPLDTWVISWVDPVSCT